MTESGGQLFAVYTIFVPLWQVDINFTVASDQKSLVGSRKSDPGSDPTGRRARWAIELLTYDFVIVHHDVSRHINADALSSTPAETVKNDGGPKGPTAG